MAEMLRLVISSYFYEIFRVVCNETFHTFLDSASRYVAKYAQPDSENVDDALSKASNRKKA